MHKVVLPNLIQQPSIVCLLHQDVDAFVLIPFAFPPAAFFFYCVTLYLEGSVFVLTISGTDVRRDVRCEMHLYTSSSSSIVNSNCEGSLNATVLGQTLLWRLNEDSKTHASSIITHCFVGEWVVHVVILRATLGCRYIRQISMLSRIFY